MAAFWLVFKIRSAGFQKLKYEGKDFFFEEPFSCERKVIFKHSEFNPAN